jgi:hypothetical protein
MRLLRRISRLAIADEARWPRRTSKPAAQDFAVICIEDEAHMFAAGIDSVGDDNVTLPAWRSAQGIAFRGHNARNATRRNRRGIRAGL